MPERQGLYDPANEHDACGMGFVAHVHGTRSRDVVESALRLLCSLAHRGAAGADAATGDGAGILLQIPHAFLRQECSALGVPIPEIGDYGVGMVFLPREAEHRAACERIIADAVAATGCRVLGWRDVPTDASHAGETARRAQPLIRQLFVARAGLALDADDEGAFERTLYLVRKRIERAIREHENPALRRCYVASLSGRTVVYKGMLRAEQLRGFYPDLADPRVVSGIALVHSRFSTNTFPSWPLAHPYRFLAHNGEINTVRGNRSRMKMREALLASPRFGAAMEELLPVLGEGQSDSASLDSVLELLVLSGRPLAHAMAMLIPEAWEGDTTMPDDRRAFYEYHAALMEPWDGPAALVFTDGRQVGAMTDRNGLRPACWAVTDDDLVVLSSEAGALELREDRIRTKGRLEPGRMLVVNTTQGRLRDDDDVKAELASLRPYRRLVAEQRVVLPAAGKTPSRKRGGERLPLAMLQRVFGYTREELRMVLAPMAGTGEEAVGSMGNDAPLAVLSERPQLLFAYFRQLFAQVTNPPIDPIREQLVMSLAVLLGAQGNLLDDAAPHPRQLRLEQPILDEPALEALGSLREPELRPRTLRALFRVAGGARALGPALDRLCRAAERAVREGCGIVILSDRAASAEWAPIPALLAVSAVRHHLARRGLGARASVVSDTGEARDVAQIALLLAFGAAAVCPYVALRTVDALAADGTLADGDASHARAAYVKAVGKGLLKVMSKMGISTLESYRGAQICEAIGLDSALVERHFNGTASRIGGIGLDVIGEETLRRHAVAFAAGDDPMVLAAGSDYHYRVEGEHHAWNPRTIATLQHATRSGSAKTFREFSRLADAESARFTLRGHLELVEREPLPLDEVEPVASIVKRFVTGAMSFGSISREAHETLAIAMNRLGGRSNTGEGGEDSSRFGTERSSAIKQIASARFGVTAEYLADARELQIKIAQGAKPGEGGQLPGHKVDGVIARTRHASPGVTLISPPPHHDIYSIEDLKQLIHDLKTVNPRATVSVKLVAESGIGTIAAGVAKAHADLISISGDSGGTGAAPLSSIKHAGIPWELGLAEVQQTLVLNGLRGRVRLQTDGQLKTGRDVVIAALLGAEEFGFATAPLIVAGCVMMRKCHLNTCPVGIATQDPVLRAKFDGQPEHLVEYFFFVAEEVRELLARLGFRTLDEIVGRTDLLRQRALGDHWKARHLDLSAILHLPESSHGATVRRCVTVQEHGLAAALDHELITLAAPALERREQVRVSVVVRNVNRSVGTMLSGEITRRHGAAGLPDGCLTVRCTGSAGQSFGAFAAHGLTLELTGEAN
ncbi:MAG TPA: glutamate synthase large subunit, partial [Gemmatimonadaceae bacterium]|nr:glutamate synthase large subunit [Gemmatimonadaceae bacterium]